MVMMMVTCESKVTDVRERFRADWRSREEGYRDQEQREGSCDVKSTAKAKQNAGISTKKRCKKKQTLFMKGEGEVRKRTTACRVYIRIVNFQRPASSI